MNNGLEEGIINDNHRLAVSHILYGIIHGNTGSLPASSCADCPFSNGKLRKKAYDLAMEANLSTLYLPGSNVQPVLPSSLMEQAVPSFPIWTWAEN